MFLNICSKEKKVNGRCKLRGVKNGYISIRVRATITDFPFVTTGMLLPRKLMTELRMSMNSS